MKLFSCWLAAFSAPLAAVTTFMIVVDFVQAVVVEPLPCEGCDDSEATTNPPQSQGDYKPLAQYWAPRIYHDTDDSYIVGDYITKVRTKSKRKQETTAKSYNAILFRWTFQKGCCRTIATPDTLDSHVVP